MTLSPAGPRRKAVFLGFAALLLPLAVLLRENRYLGSGDTAPAELLPISLLGDGDLAFDEFVSGAGTLPYWFRFVDGRVVSNYSIWPGLANVPVFFVARGLGVPLYENRLLLSLYTAALLTAFSVFFLYRALLRVCRSQMQAFFFAMVYFFGTGVWSVAGRGLFQHTPSIFFLTMALLLLVRDRPASTAFAGLALGLAVVNRPTDLLIAVPLAAFVLAQRRRELPRFLALAAVPALLHAWYCWKYWGTPFSTGQLGEIGIVSFGGNFREGIAGLLVSPSRGLLVFSPIFLFAVPALVAAFRRLSPPLDRFLAVSVLLVIGVYALWGQWWGGHSFGYRLLLDLVPLLIFLIARSWPELRPLPGARAAFALCLAASVYVQYLGAKIYPMGRFNEAAERDLDLLWSVPRSEIVRDTLLVLRRRGVTVTLPVDPVPAGAPVWAPPPEPVWWSPEVNDETIAGALDWPGRSAVFSGPLTARGWAASLAGPVEVQILVSPEGRASEVTRGARADVCRVFPQFRDCSAVGFAAPIARGGGSFRHRALIVEMRDPRGCVRRLGPFEFRWNE